MPARSKTSNEGGFTIIEVMVACMLLLIGMLGTMALIDRADEATASTRAREGGTTLAREIVEQARAIPFTDLSTTALTPALQAIPGLADTAGPGWTIRRRNVDYTVVAEVCAIDDPRDGLGDHADGGYCAGSGTGTVDPGPKDFKQITARVTYSFGGQSKEVKLTTLVSTNGAADAPGMTDLQALSPPTFSDARAPIVTQPIGTVSQVQFEAAASASASNVIWSVDGLDKGQATKVGSVWRFTVPLTGMVDGDYAIGARGVDSNGAEGVVREVTLRLVRAPSAAVTGLVAGPNAVRVSGSSVDAVELEWIQSPEKNVYGYRVYRETGASTNTWTQIVCQPATSTSDLNKTAACVDQNPVYARYKIVPVYQNAAGNMVETPNAALVGPVSPPGPGVLYLSSAAAASTTYCNAVARVMQTSVPNGTDLAAPIGSSGAFCTTAAAPGMGFLAGPSVAHLWARNTHAGQNCSYTLNMRASGPSGSTLVGSRAASIPNRTDTPTRFDVSINHSAFMVGATSRLVLDITGANGNGCNSTTIHAGSAAYVSSIDVPGAGSPPNAPTGLNAVRQADGSVQLSWAAPPAGGPTVAFYRIYRGGRDVTQRIDRTGSATPTTFTDPKPPANSTYYVTAVTSTLGESATLGPVTG